MFSFLRNKRKKFSEIIEDRHISIAQKLVGQIDKASSFTTINVYDFKKLNYSYEYAFGAFSAATMDFPKVKMNVIGLKILQHAYILFCRDILRETDDNANLLFQTCLIMIEANPHSQAFVEGQKDGVRMINGSSPDTLFRYLFDKFYQPSVPWPDRQ